MWIIYDDLWSSSHFVISPKKGCFGCRTSIGTSGSPVGSQVLVVAPRKSTALDHALPDGLVVTCQKLRTSQNLEISTKKKRYLCWKKIIRTSQNIVGSFMKSEYIETSFRYFSIPLIAGETWDLRSPRQLSHPRGSGASFRSRPVRYADPGSWPTG